MRQFPSMRCISAMVFLFGTAYSAFTNAADNRANPPTPLAADAIFSDANSPDKPALAITVLQHGKVIYEKAFGSANLASKTPATVHTTFQVDRLAWEFIAYAILALEQQGKLRLDDDIRTYLPAMPDYGAKVTINHLLSSTDGVHGFKVLKSLAGWTSREPDHYESILPLIRHQKQLNFTPGRTFSPGGDTRMILLAKIIEVATGQSLDAYSSATIFGPLGMQNTRFVRDHAAIPHHSAVPYHKNKDGAYSVDQGGSAIAGASNLYTSIHDLSIWRAHIAAQASVADSPANKLALPIRFDGGPIIKDISSISILGQQHAGKERGIPKIYQTGTSGGFASSYFHFPEHGVTAIALSSGLDYNGSYAMRAAALLLKDDFKEPETIDYAKLPAMKLSTAQLKRYEGNYWHQTRVAPATIRLEDGVLRYARNQNTKGRELIPLGPSTFQMKIEGDDHYILEFVDHPDGAAMHYRFADSDPLVFTRYDKAEYDANALQEFAGIYRNHELDASFVLAAHQGSLVASNLRAGTVNLQPLAQDMFLGDQGFMGSIRFSRNDGNEISGFQVAVDEVRNLEFRKIR